jgi:hypothetical protein
MDLEREVNDLRQANQILKPASGFLAQATASTAG